MITTSKCIYWWTSQLKCYSWKESNIIPWLQTVTQSIHLAYQQKKKGNDKLHNILQYIHVDKTSQLRSLEVYFWYHHQNFYKTFSDNNILKEEPYFCAWTRSPQKCFRSEYSKKKKKNPSKKKKGINNKPTTKENNAAHIYTLQKSMLSAGNGWEGDSGDPLVYMESV